MANEKYCVIRTDLMSASDNCADLVSLRFYDADGKVAPVENGVIVELKGYEEGEREVMKAVAATADTPIDSMAIVAGVEVEYDERKKNLEDYINAAGKAVRGIIPRKRNVFSVTAEGFAAAAPAVGGKVGIGANGKMDASATGFGECVHIETQGRYTYYGIKITKA